jgi:FKBP12-rapamycin complex-associated protein
MLITGDRNEQRRYAAILVLKELALNSATLVYSYVPQILDCIWVALRDQKVFIREGAAEALRASLKLVQIRENQMKKNLYKKLFEEAQKGIKGNTNPDIIHGSLLALCEISIHTVKFQDGRFSEICNIILKFREHRDPLVKKTIIQMIPILAELDPEQFYKDSNLSVSMTYLISQLKRDREKAVGMFFSPLIHPSFYFNR